MNVENHKQALRNRVSLTYHKAIGELEALAKLCEQNGDFGLAGKYTMDAETVRRLLNNHF